MKTKYFVCCLLFFIVGVIYWGCKKDSNGNIVIPPPPTPSGKGNLKGQINPKTECGDTNDYKNFLIFIDSLGIQTNSDSTGKWKIDSLNTGKVTVRYSKNGYSPFKKLGVVIKSDSTIHLVQNIYRLPLARVYNLINVIYYQLQEIHFLGEVISYCSDYYSVHVFFSKDSNVSVPPTNYMYHFQSEYFCSPPGHYTFNESYGYYGFYDRGFIPGDTVYGIAYPDYGLQIYPDYQSGKTVYSSIGTVPSNKIKFILP
jgi:hypothetical protein